jgi:hypothetical protein
MRPKDNLDGYYGGEYYGILSPRTALYPGSGGGPFNYDFWNLATPPIVFANNASLSTGLPVTGTATAAAIKPAARFNSGRAALCWRRPVSPAAR